MNVVICLVRNTTSWLAAGLCLFVFTSVTLAARDSNASENWAELAAAVDTTGFSRAFVDSLRGVDSVIHGEALRRIAAPVFSNHETLVFEASWGIVRAGYGVIETHVDSAGGTARISLRAVSNRFVSGLYRVRDLLRSTVSLEGVYPLFFEEHIEEGRYKRKRWALFDHARGITFTSSRRKPRIETPAYTHDFVSLLYFLRTMAIAPGDTFSLSCYVQGKVYPVFFECTKRDTLKTSIGSQPCLVLEPRIVADGRNFSRRDRVRLWLTDSPEHVLVRINAKLNVGSVNGELIHYRRETAERPNPLPDSVFPPADSSAGQ